jgi:hypothetical protein
MTRRVTLVLPDDVAQWVDRVCEAEGRSTSEQLRRMLRIARHIEQALSEPGAEVIVRRNGEERSPFFL